MINKSNYSIFIIVLLLCVNCKKEETQMISKTEKQNSKEVVYQVFTRLFGNTNSTNKPWGTIEENGVGKFNDFSDQALQEIKDLGVTHIWYTGVLHHATITDYSAYGISNDDPDIVKGRAGSPYAVKDYYNVNPDLAIDPAKRLEEFEALIKRTHQNDMKVIIDIVPNHIARNYHGLTNPKGILDFGAEDDQSITYHRDNNFYYVVGEPFKVPNWENGYLPLGGEKNPKIDGKFEENPAKWTGNGSRLAQPNFYDWYETVKINYGVKPDGTEEFDQLPADFDKKDDQVHYDFWKDKEVPNSWVKFKDIALYWLEKGVDGFRYDMAEMVPVEFWSYLNSFIKHENPEAFLLAEVYNPSLYRDYIHLGKMDYLYDKVALYDSIKGIMQGHGSTDYIVNIQEDLKDIEKHMLHFLENHDEQRIASPEFAGNAIKGKPAMVLSATINTAPTMIYFGQEVGEPGAENPGFGSASRTSIFDYVGVPHHQRWVNDKKFDGGKLSSEEKELRDFYKRLLNFTIGSEALMGGYQELHSLNRNETEYYNNKVFSFARWNENEKLIILTNFHPEAVYEFNLKIPASLIEKWELKNKTYQLNDQLYNQKKFDLNIKQDAGYVPILIHPLESFILKLE